MFRSTIAKSLVNASPRAARPVARPVLARAYHEKVISHYEKPRNVCLDPVWTFVVCRLLSDNSCACPRRLGPSPRTTRTSAQAWSVLLRTFLLVVRRVLVVVRLTPIFVIRCGDVMKLQIKVDENGVISDVKFKTFGCGSAIASSSYMTERVKGLSLEEAEKIKNTEIAKELCLPPVKLHCSSERRCLPPYIRDTDQLSVLAEDAIRSAIRDYRTKRTKAGEPKKSGFIDVSQSVATGETVATAHPPSA